MLGVWRDQWKATALGALFAAAILIDTLANLKPWRRPAPPDIRPRLVRFATWLLGTVAFGSFRACWR